MAKKAAPWFWEARNGWYITVGGERHFLGEHPADAPRPKKGKRGWNSPPIIDEAYRSLLGGKGTAPVDDEAIVNVLDDFIVWSKENRAENTVERYERFCQSFVTYQPEN